MAGIVRADTFRMNTIKSQDSDVTAMTINASGHVLKPQVPAWMVGISGSYNHTNGNDVQYNTTAGNGGFDQGNNWDFTTYEYVVPTTGIYFMYATASVNTGEETRAANIRIKVNGTSDDANYIGRGQIDATLSGGGSYNRVFGSWTRSLTAGDKVTFNLSWETDGGSDGFDSTESVHTHATYCTGYLVG